MRSLLLVIALLFASLPSRAEPSAEARLTAWEVVQELRRFGNLVRLTIPGAQPASEAELQNYERNLAQILDKDTQKEYLCGLISFAIVQEQTLVIGYPQIMEDYIPPRPGSLDDWLRLYALRVVPSVISGNMSPARAAQFVSWECRQQPLTHILHSSIPRFSQEMRDIEACERDEALCPEEEDWEWPEDDE